MNRMPHATFKLLPGGVSAAVGVHHASSGDLGA
jgi:hypothetical protein